MEIEFLNPSFSTHAVPEPVSFSLTLFSDQNDDKTDAREKEKNKITIFFSALKKQVP